jgi:sulfonate dioxygenase
MSFTHTGITEQVLAYRAPDPPVKEFEPPKDRAFFADPEKKSLFAAAKQVRHLTPYIGTELVGIQLSQLSDAQKDELALLVAEVSPAQDIKPLPSTDGIAERCGILQGTGHHA